MPIDTKKASLALVDWIESQDISPEEAIPVLVHTLRSIIHQIAKKRGADVNTGLDVVANMIRKPESEKRNG